MVKFYCSLNNDWFRLQTDAEYIFWMFGTYLIVKLIISCKCGDSQLQFHEGKGVVSCLTFITLQSVNTIYRTMKIYSRFKFKPFKPTLSLKERTVP